MAEAETTGKFALGDRVTKVKGASWTGRVVGFYSTALTPTGDAVESESEAGSVQIYPEQALALAAAPSPSAEMQEEIAQWRAKRETIERWMGNVEYNAAQTNNPDYHAMLHVYREVLGLLDGDTAAAGGA